SKDRKVFSQLSGVSLKARVSLEKVAFTDDMLFTHKGLSGPAILQISSHWKEGDEITIDLLPETNILDKMKSKKRGSGKVMIKNFLSGFMPQRLAFTFCEKRSLNKNLADYSDDKMNEICNALHQWKLMPAGTEGFSKAEATLGGVDTADISSKNMESHKVEGLYFIGEVVDVVGELGGYNLHWAWASGFAAGKYV
ncbi:MAG: aminoacetone oxidase family FAD-binding enzyme, partial [Pseudomonadota bacterium]